MSLNGEYCRYKHNLVLVRSWAEICLVYLILPHFDLSSLSEAQRKFACRKSVKLLLYREPWRLRIHRALPPRPYVFIPCCLVKRTYNLTFFRPESADPLGSWPPVLSLPFQRLLPLWDIFCTIKPVEFWPTLTSTPFRITKGSYFAVIHSF